MYQFSDSDSVDSDEGIRYKTESIRNKKHEERVILHPGRGSCRIKKPKSCKRRSTEKREPRNRTRERSHEDVKNSRNRNRENEQTNNRRNRKDVVDTDSKKRNSYDDQKSKTKIIKERVIPGPSLPNEKIQKNIDLKSSTSTKENEGNLPFGPTIPPKMKEESDENAFGPQLPPHLTQKTNSEDSTIGPILPSHFITVSSLDDDSCSTDPDSSKVKVNKESSSQCNTIGPVLPPHLSKQNEETVIGPVLPQHLRQELESSSLTPNEEKEDMEDEDVYGPLPAGAQFSKAHIELEERALQMKMEQLEPADKKPTREEWMLTLPEAKAANFGLGPRQFRNKAGPDLSDRSSWTDTPEDKAKKKEGKVEPVVDLKKEAELKQIKSRDREQEKIAKKHKTEKDSLLDIHRKKLKKEKKGESGPSERRPFNRETDLQVNRFDEAQKKAVLKKAQLLDSRFSSGESKFL